MRRREFLRRIGSTAAGAIGASLLPRLAREALALEPSPPSEAFDLLVVRGKDYPLLIRQGLRMMGFPGKFLKPGMKVVLKPNAAWSRPPEQAATTHPLLVAETVRVCLESGAGSVEVVEHPCDNFHSAFRISGIQEAVEKAGARMHSLSQLKDFVPVTIPSGKTLKKAEVSNKILAADCFLSLPIAKVHGSATLTMAMKNHMGTVEDRWAFHKLDLHQCIADISSYLKAHLTILDCTRILITRGPKGPGAVKVLDQVIFGTDQVAVDAYATTLFGMKPDDIGYLKAAKQMGLGETDLTQIRVKEISL